MTNPFNEYRKKEKNYETAGNLLKYTGFAGVFYSSFIFNHPWDIAPLTMPFLNALSIWSYSKSKKAQKQRKALSRGEEIKESKLMRLCGFS